MDQMRELHHLPAGADGAVLLDPAPARRFEYRVLELRKGRKLGRAALAAALGELGDVGWEVVQIERRGSRRRTVVMKRERPDA